MKLKQEKSLASVKRAREKEQKNLNKDENKENLKPIKRDINIPEAITVRELANRMAEQSSNVIKYLFGMGVTVTINQTLAADTAEFLVKEFGHNPIREEKAEEIIQKIKATRVENLKNRPPIVTVMGHVDHGKTPCRFRCVEKSRRCIRRIWRYNTTHRRISNREQIKQINFY